ncbi:MAG: cyclic nucleotide-binding domain-containing protein, partial [Pseudomonadota bacterium]
MAIATTIKGHDLFAALSVDDVKRVSQFSATRTYEMGEWVFRHDAPASHVFILLKGSVQLKLHAGTNDVGMAIARIEPGYLLGLSALFGDTRYTSGAQTLERCEVLAMEGKLLRGLLQESPQVGYSIMNAVAKGFCDRYLEVLRRLQGILD